MAPQLTIYSFIPAFLLFLPITTAATCYRPDTHVAMDAIYTPCNTNTPYSMCLRSAVDIYGSAPDRACLPNGLVVTAYAGEQFWREGCTDASWESGYCLKAFNACTVDSNGNTQVTSCDGSANSSTWCCGGNNTACCGSSAQGAISIAQTVGPSLSSSMLLSTTASSSSTVFPTTSSAPPINAAPTSTNDNSSLSIGAEIGIIVGATAAGLLVLGTLLTWLVLKRRQKLRMKDMDMNVQDPDIWRGYLDGKNAGELGGKEVVEIDEPPVRYELQS